MVTATADLERGETQGDLTLSLNGILQDGGKQCEFTARLAGDVVEGEQTYDVEGVADVIVVFDQEVYLRLQLLNVAPPHPLLQEEALKGFQGQWWKLPTPEKPSQTVTPNPRLLKAQAEVIEITRDRGLETMQQRDVYHYDVILDREKLKTFLRGVAEERGEEFREAEAEEFLKGFETSGEIWIDAETFYVHRLVWNITPAQKPVQKVSFTLRADLSEHNAAPLVTPPETFSEFSPLMFMSDESLLERALDGSTGLTTGGSTLRDAPFGRSSGQAELPAGGGPLLQEDPFLEENSP
jgi:hypothetical protein